MIQIELKKTCSLARFGYALDKSKTARARTLRKAVSSYGSRYVIQKLVVLRTYRKSKKTAALKRQWSAIDADIKFVQGWRDALSPSDRQKDKERSRAWRRLAPSKKSFC